MDAFTEGVSPDGLKSRNEIRILICYLLKGANQPISRQAVSDLCFRNGFSNYFETAEAISDLIECGSVIKNENDELLIGDSGVVAANSLYSRLPITIRERAMNAALNLFARLKIERENEVDIKKTKSGYLVECKSIDNGEIIMSFSLATCDEEQARTIRDRFLENPSKVYESLINMTLLNEK